MKQVNENGFWRIENNPISQVGVFPYLGKNISEKLDPNKIYFVYRPSEELFAPETLESFNSTPLPLVDEHEMLGDGATPAEHKGIHGVISNVRQDGKLLVGDISIYSETMKDEINRGKKDLSMGYYCEYDIEEGEYDGQHYDAVQRNLRGNHVALVDQGRCGHSVRVYDHFALDADFKEDDHPRDEMGKFTSSGTNHQKGDNLKFKTLKETPKALLLEKEGTSFWIQKRWMREDGTLTAAGQKAYNTAKNALKVSESDINISQEKPDYESEKALGYDSRVLVHYGAYSRNGQEYTKEFEKKVRVFIPKSMIKNGAIPEWLVQKKIKEIKELVAKETGERVWNNIDDFLISGVGFIDEYRKKYGIKDFAFDSSEEINGVCDESECFLPILINIEEQTAAQDADDQDTTSVDGNKNTANDSGYSASTDDAINPKDSVSKEENKMTEELKAKDGDLVIKHDDEEEEVKDASVDKRELIREIGAIAGQAGMSEELVRTLMQKAEQLAYNGSEQSEATDACGKDEDAEMEEEIKETEDSDEEKDEEKISKLVEKKVEDALNGIDLLALIESKKNMLEKVRPLVGDFDASKMTNNDIAKYACDKLNIKATSDSANDVLDCYLNMKGNTKIYSTADSMDDSADDIIARYKRGE
jgi:hypothetical protein